MDHSDAFPDGGNDPRRRDCYLRYPIPSPTPIGSRKCAADPFPLLRAVDLGGGGCVVLQKSVQGVPPSGVIATSMGGSSAPYQAVYGQVPGSIRIVKQ